MTTMSSKAKAKAMEEGLAERAREFYRFVFRTLLQSAPHRAHLDPTATIPMAQLALLSPLNPSLTSLSGPKSVLRGLPRTRL